MCVAWLALLLCALCCFPCPAQALWCRATCHSLQPFPTALPSGQPWHPHVRPRSASAQGSRCTACWQRLVWWPLSKLCVFSEVALPTFPDSLQQEAFAWPVTLLPTLPGRDLSNFSAPSLPF